MHISKNAITLLKKLEGLRLKAYKCVSTEKYYTIGYGHYGADVGADMEITESQAEELLIADLPAYEAIVNKYDAIYHWNQNQYDALCVYCYNVGNLKTLTKNGTLTVPEISQEFSKHNTSSGIPLAGLTARRAQEKALFDREADIVAKYSITASQIITLARNYKDWQEKSKIGTRAQMWQKHWSPGDANYTIWAMLFDDYTGINLQGQAWCVMFDVTILVLALINSRMSQEDAIAAAKDMLGGSLPYNCADFVTKHKLDQRMGTTPKVGCPVIFWTGSKYGHWGRVTGVDTDGKGFTSIEGNTSGGADKIIADGGAVVEKWHSLTGKEYFWDLELSESKEEALKEYSILNGETGLQIKGASALNLRSYPKTGAVIGTLQEGQKVFPSKKVFVDGKAWYFANITSTLAGWFSAAYVEGWVMEENGEWWYVLPGYEFDVSKWREIDGKWYYFDRTGYMAHSCYVRSKDGETYYWVGDDGAYQGLWDTKSPNLEKYGLAI